MPAFQYRANNATLSTSYPSSENGWYTVTSGHEQQAPVSPSYSIVYDPAATPDQPVELTRQAVVADPHMSFATPTADQYTLPITPLPDSVWETSSDDFARTVAGTFAITPQELGIMQNSSTSYLRSVWSRTASVWDMTHEIMDEDTPFVSRVPVENWPRSLSYTVTVTNTTGSSSGPPVQWVAPSGTTTFFVEGTTSFFHDPSFDEPVDEYDLMQRIKEPLTTLMRRHPTTISVLLEKIEQGMIDGSTYGPETHFQTHPLSPRACCLVGWMVRAKRLSNESHRSLQVRDRGVLEGYISNVHQGQTHTTNFRLAVLHYLLTKLAQECVEKRTEKKRTPKRSPSTTPLLDEIGKFLRGERATESDLIRTP